MTSDTQQRHTINRRKDINSQFWKNNYICHWKNFYKQDALFIEEFCVQCISVLGPVKRANGVHSNTHPAINVIPRGKHFGTNWPATSSAIGSSACKQDDFMRENRIAPGNSILAIFPNDFHYTLEKYTSLSKCIRRRTNCLFSFSSFLFFFLFFFVISK